MKYTEILAVNEFKIDWICKQAILNKILYKKEQNENSCIELSKYKKNIVKKKRNTILKQTTE